MRYFFVLFDFLAGFCAGWISFFLLHSMGVFNALPF